jgi:hypothetical protein
MVKNSILSRARNKAMSHSPLLFNIILGVLASIEK